MAEVTIRTATATQPGAADRSRNRFAAVIVVAHTLKHAITSGVPAVLIPEIKLSLGLSATQVGALGTTSQLTGWLATMSAGYLGDRFTRHTGLMLGVSLAMTAVSLGVMSLAPGYGLILAAMLLMGFGPSMFHPPAIGALSRRFADRRSLAISLHGTGGSAGEVLGPLAAAGLLALLYWRDVLRVEFVAGIVGAFLTWRLIAANHGRDEHHHGAMTGFRDYLASFLGLLRRRALLLLFLITGLRAVGQAITTVFLPVYMREDLGYSSALIGVYIAMSQLAGIGSQPLMGMMADRYGHKAVILPAMAAFALILAIIPLADGKAQLALVMLALGCFSFSMQSILTSAAIELAGGGVHSTVTSLVYAAGFIGSLSPTIAGVLADAYGLKSTFVFSACVVATGALILALTRIPRNAPKVTG